MNTVIDQPQFAIHVFARESEPISSPILPSDVSDLRTAGIHTARGVRALPRLNVDAV